MHDVTGEQRDAPERLRTTTAFVAGEELPARPLPLPPPWIALTAQQRAIRARAAAGEHVDLAAELDEVVELPPLAEAD
jgi:hypothetical protein